MPVDYSKFDNIEDSDEEKPVEKTVTKKPAPAPKVVKCANCGNKDGPLKKCTVCGKVVYCSTRCQRDDWRFHKRTCAPPKKDEKKDGKKDGAARPAKPRAPKAKKVVVSSSDDDDDDTPITWYKHRETKLPPSKVVHTRLETAPAAAPAAPATGAAPAPSGGSVWNTAGTWEERDILPFAKDAVEAALGRVPDRDFGSGVVSLDTVKGVEGDASVGVIRGKTRHIVDLTVKIGFKVRLGGDGKAYKGTLVLKEYSADARTEAVDVELKFTDGARLGRTAEQRVRDALGTKSCVAPTETPKTFVEDCIFALNLHFLPRLFEQ